MAYMRSPSGRRATPARRRPKHRPKPDRRRALGLLAGSRLSATAPLATPIAVSFVPPFPAKAARDNSHGEIPHRPWLTLVRQRAFVRVTLVAALVLGSHAMHDSFAVIRWTQAGIGNPLVGILLSDYACERTEPVMTLGKAT